MRREVFCLECPGCAKRIHAPSKEKRDAAFVRHFRNCNALRKDAEGMLAKLEAGQ